MSVCLLFLCLLQSFFILFALCLNAYRVPVTFLVYSFFILVAVLKSVAASL